MVHLYGMGVAFTPLIEHLDISTDARISDTRTYLANIPDIGCFYCVRLRILSRRKVKCPQEVGKIDILRSR